MQSCRIAVLLRFSSRTMKESWGGIGPSAQVCTRSIQLRQYKRTIIARSRLRQGFNELIDFARGVVEMWGDPKAISMRRCDDVSLFQMSVEAHCRLALARFNTNNLRLLTRRARAHNLVVPGSESLA